MRRDNARDDVRGDSRAARYLGLGTTARLAAMAVGLCMLHCGGATTSGSVGGLAVQSTPSGELSGPLEITLEFSHAMVEADAVGRADALVPLSIEPAIEGEGRWIDEKTLVFLPTASLPVSTQFSATVPAGASAVDGTKLASAHTFEFSTERLSGQIRLLDSSERAPTEPRVKVVFNHEVTFATVAAHCAYRGADQTRKPIVTDLRALGAGKVFTVVPDAPLPIDSSWTFSCAADLKGTVGNLGLAAPVEQPFKTYGALAFVSLSPSGTDIVPEDDRPLELAFTNPLKRPYKMSLSPAVPGFPERCHSLGDAPPGLSCDVRLAPRTAYTLEIAGEQADVFGQALGTDRKVLLRTTDAEPTASLESGFFVAELAHPVLPVWTRNVTGLDVTAVAVEPANFHELRPLINWWDSDPIDLDESALAHEKARIPVAGAKNEWHQHRLDPAALLGAEAGPGMYYIEVGSSEVERGAMEDGGVRKVLVNFTDIGLVTKLSATGGMVWATRLSSGEPLPGAAIAVRNAKGRVTWTGRTDASGVAVLPARKKLDGPRSPGDEERHYYEGSNLRVYAQKGTDWTMVDPGRSGELAAWNFNVSPDYDKSATRLRGFLHTDRGLYRPGEKVHIKGLARETRLGSPLSVPSRRDVAVVITGPRGRTFTEAAARLSPYGGFWLDVDLPGDARLGDYTIRATLDSGVFTGSFQVEEYRAATFEVSGKTSVKRVEHRGTVEATIAANYLYGAPVRAGEVALTVHSRPRRVRFAEHDDFAFVDQRRYDSYRHYAPDYSQDLVTEDVLALDSDGNATLSFSVSPDDVRRDADLLVRAAVTAPNDEVINKSFAIPYFRSKRYFGINSPGYFARVGETHRVEVVGVSPSGKQLSGKARVEVTRRDWNCVWEDWGYRGSYNCKETLVTVMKDTIELRSAKPTPVEFQVDGGGQYWIVVESADGNDDDAPAAVRMWAWGGGGSWRASDSMRFDIVADKSEYRVGDTATLLLQTDLAEATGLVTIERDGVIERKVIEVTAEGKHIRVPIEGDYAPNVYVSVALVQGRMGPGERGKPRMRMGVVNLPVRAEENELVVTVETSDEDYRPGDTVTATVKVTDARGRPVAAEVALTAADEGVLSLIGYKTPDPLPAFYAPWGLGVTSATQYAFIKDIPAPGLERPATGGDSGGGSLRSRFLSTAVWLPSVVTNGRGVATARFEAPDNLTAFRVMAVAADRGARFGSGDVRFTVSKPLQLHRVLPRFLTRGDELRGGVVVHNETGAAGSATVSVETGDAVTVIGGASRTVDVPAGGRVPVLFDLRAASEGDAALTFSAIMAGERDRVRFQLPVHHPSPERVEPVARGTTADDRAIEVSLPKHAQAEGAEIHVSVDPDGLAGIENGLRDLVGYPYGCLEQTTSKVIPMLAARDLAESLSLDGLDGSDSSEGSDLERFVSAGVAKIGRHQTQYGGFSLWPGGEPSAYYTAYALWGLSLAKQAGFPVDSSRISDGISYLKDEGRRADTDKPYYSSTGYLGDQAFALYVRAMLDDDVAQAATALRDQLDDLPLYGKAFLLRALAKSLGAADPAVVELRNELAAAAKTAAAAGRLLSEAKSNELRGYMSGDMRTTAIVLGALVNVAPDHDAIAPMVRVLMRERRRQRYLSTQANLYSLLSLSDYARSRSDATRSVVVQVGDQQVVAGPLRDKERLRVGSLALPAEGASVAIRPAGGEVHYSVEVRYRQTADTLVAESNGLSLTREYLEPDGTAKTSFRVGDLVRVRLSMPLSDSVHHLMLSDRLPAAFEALNQRLATVGDVGRVASRQRWWGGYRDLRDERVDFAAGYNWRATYVREYMARVTSAGSFAVPPAVAELMYEPEKNARTALTTLTVEAR